MTEPSAKCDVCGKTSEDGVNLKNCERCNFGTFCSDSCRNADGPSHARPLCSVLHSLETKWYNRHRHGMSGFHPGALELITEERVEPITGERMGWGNCLVEEGPELKRKYEEDFGGDDSKLFEEWPQAYRYVQVAAAAAAPDE